MSERNDPYLPFSNSSKPVAVPIYIAPKLIPDGRAVPILNGLVWFDKAVSMVVSQPLIWLMTIGLSVGFWVACIFCIRYLLEKEWLSANPDSTGTFVYFFLFSFFHLAIFSGIICVAESQKSRKPNPFLLFNGFFLRMGGVSCIVIIDLVLRLIVNIIVGIIIYNIISSNPALIRTFEYMSELGDNNVAQLKYLFSELPFIIKMIGIEKSIFVFALMLTLQLLAYSVTLFALPSMLIHGSTFSSAIGMSIVGCMKNILPGIIYFLAVSVVMGLISFLIVTLGENKITPYAMIGLGIFIYSLYLIFVNLVTYIAYKNIYTTENF